jgi:hypothetical protein
MRNTTPGQWPLEQELHIASQTSRPLNETLQLCIPNRNTARAYVLLCLPSRFSRRSALLTPYNLTQHGRLQAHVQL